MVSSTSSMRKMTPSAATVGIEKHTGYTNLIVGE